MLTFKNEASQGCLASIQENLAQCKYDIPFLETKISERCIFLDLKLRQIKEVNLKMQNLLSSRDMQKMQ
jgi:hypothetical protein